MRRINTAQYLGCSELLRLFLLPQNEVECCLFSVSSMCFFYLHIVRLSLQRKNLQPSESSISDKNECSLALEKASQFGLNIQTNFPPELPLAPSFSGAPASCSPQACCLPWMSNRRGTWCTQAGLVIPSYVCTPDVLLTSIDFFTQGTFFFLEKGNLAGVKGIAGDEFLMNPFFPFL